MRRIKRTLKRARVAELEQEIAQLRERDAQLSNQIRALQARADAVPGVTVQQRDWAVVVGGERVGIKAIPPVEWINSIQELPEFLFAFATTRATPTGQAKPEALNEMLTLAKRWITACAIDTVNLDRLTVPEAEHAITQISELNGVTAALREWFQHQRVGEHRPHSGAVPNEAERVAGSAAN